MIIKGGKREIDSKASDLTQPDLSGCVCVSEKEERARERKSENNENKKKKKDNQQVKRAYYTLFYLLVCEFKREREILVCTHPDESFH